MIFIDDVIPQEILNNSTTFIYYTAPTWIIPNDQTLINIFYQNLSTLPHMKVYLKEDIPVEYHFKNNRRTTAIVCIPELGETINIFIVIHSIFYYIIH
jgi:hypothetical protein